MRQRRGFTVVEIMVTLVILSLLAGLAVGALTAWRESSRIQTSFEIIQGDLEFAAQQSRVFSLVPAGSSGAGVPPPHPDTELVARVVKRDLGRPMEIIREHPIGKGFEYLVSGDVVTVDVAGSDFQGVAFQIAPKDVYSSGCSIVFSGTGQPVTLAGGPIVVTNPPVITFGTERSARELRVTGAGAISSKTLNPSPFTP